MIRVPCPGCEKTLRVPDAMAGRAAACPRCKRKFRVPEVVEPIEETDEEVDERISTSPPARSVNPRKPRRPAQDEDEPLRKAKRPRAEENDEDAYAVESEPSPEPSRSRRRRRSISRFNDEEADRPSKRPHRGGLILTLGIISLVLGCIPLVGWILGGITMSMASTDDRLMAHGSMQRSGRTMTKVGQVCGIIGVFLATVSFILGLYIRFRHIAR